MTADLNERMREQGLAESGAIADRLAPTIREAAALLPDPEAQMQPVLEAEVALATTQQKAAGVGEAALRQFTIALVAGLAERLDEIAGAAAEAARGQLH